MSTEPGSTERRLRDDRADGRILRGERTRDRIVDALLSLLSEGTLTPTGSQIAGRAGVSVRSIFQHFEDLEGLLSDLATRQAQRVLPLLDDLSSDGTLDERIDALVRQRSELFEFIAPIRHALGTRVYDSPAIRRRIDELSAHLLAQVELQFAAELAAMEPAPRRHTLDAVDAITSFQTWDLLREFRGLGRVDAEATMRTALWALLRSVP